MNEEYEIADGVCIDEDSCEIFDEDENISIEERHDEIIDLMTGGEDSE